MARSGNPVYQTAVDMMLIVGLAEICRSYYRVRNLPWEGEKATVRYLQEHDADYLALLRECIFFSLNRRRELW